jgi:hypothetical protein
VRAEAAQEPLLSAVCPWCGSAEEPSAAGFCPGCHQSREAVDRAWYCEGHGGYVDTATLVMGPPAPTLVAHRMCPACGFSFDVPAVVSTRPRRRRRWRFRTLEVALGAATAVGLLLYGTDRTGDIVTPAGPAVSKAATMTPRQAISHAFGYDVGPCLQIYQSDSGTTYLCGEGDIATIHPDGTVRQPSLWP